MKIERNKIYEFDNYKFVNFINLKNQIIEQIRIWRNHPDIRKYMYNSDEITYEDHFRFINSLKNRKDEFYWLVYKNNDPIGVINLTNIDYTNERAEYGYYILPNKLKEGMGLEFIPYILTFFFKKLEINILTGATEISNMNALIINRLMGNIVLPQPKIINNKKYVQFICEKLDFLASTQNFKDVKQKVKLIKKYKQELIELINQWN